MNKVIVLCGLILLFISILSPPASANDEAVSKSFPFPLAEMEKVVCRWLADGRYDVSRDAAEGGEIRLTCRKEHLGLFITLTPRSPLVTEILAKSSKGEIPRATSQLGELWSFLESYSGGFPASPMVGGSAVPDSVLHHSTSVVCIETGPGRLSIQLTGFFIAEEGLLVTTAHDLNESYSVTLILNDGRKIPGRVLRTDFRRDLALIQTGYRPGGFVAVNEGRVLLDPDERIYTIGCPEKHKGILNAGVVNAPLRLPDNLPLWEVSMRVLPGSSGSPVFDARGRLVAVVKGHYRGNEGVGFLIPLLTLKDFLSR